MDGEVPLLVPMKTSTTVLEQDSLTHHRWHTRDEACLLWAAALRSLLLDYYRPTPVTEGCH